MDWELGLDWEALRTGWVGLSHHAPINSLNMLVWLLLPDEPEPGYTLFGKSGTADIAVVPPFVTADDGTRVQMGKPKGAGGYYHEQYCSW